MTRYRRPELMLKRLWRWVLMRVRVRVRLRAHLVRTSQARVRDGRPNTSMAAREARRSPTSPSMAPALLLLSSPPHEL